MESKTLKNPPKISIIGYQMIDWSNCNCYEYKTFKFKQNYKIFGYVHKAQTINLVFYDSNSDNLMQIYEQSNEQSTYSVQFCKIPMQCRSVIYLGPEISKQEQEQNERFKNNCQWVAEQIKQALAIRNKIKTQFSLRYFFPSSSHFLQICKNKEYDQQSDEDSSLVEESDHQQEKPNHTPSNLFNKSPVRIVQLYVIPSSMNFKKKVFVWTDKNYDGQFSQNAYQIKEMKEDEKVIQNVQIYKIPYHALALAWIQLFSEKFEKNSVMIVTNNTIKDNLSQEQNGSDQIDGINPRHRGVLYCHKIFHLLKKIRQSKDKALQKDTDDVCNFMANNKALIYCGEKNEKWPGEGKLFQVITYNISDKVMDFA